MYELIDDITNYYKSLDYTAEELSSTIGIVKPDAEPPTKTLLYIKSIDDGNTIYFIPIVLVAHYNKLTDAQQDIINTDFTLMSNFIYYKSDKLFDNIQHFTNEDLQLLETYLEDFISLTT